MIIKIINFIYFIVGTINSLDSHQIRLQGNTIIH